MLPVLKYFLWIYLFGSEFIPASPDYYNPRRRRNVVAPDGGGVMHTSRPDRSPMMMIPRFHQSPANVQHHPRQTTTNNSNGRWFLRNLQFGGGGCVPGYFSWLYEQIGSTDVLKLGDAQLIQIYSVSHKGFFDTQDADEFFGPNGMYTDEIATIREQLDAFWKINNPIVPTNETLVLGTRAELLLDDTEKLNIITDIIYCSLLDMCSLTDEELDSITRALVDPVVQSLGIDNPALDAIAAVTADVEELSDYEVNLKGYAIVVGDGMFTFFEDTNQIELGPAYVLAHEYGHVLQHELGLFDDREEAESVDGLRRLELMADAFAAYFLGHEQGGNLTLDEVDEIFLTARSFGDYLITEPGHHGTPAQRECATIHYASVGLDATTVTTVQELIIDFDEKLPLILQADDMVCPNVTLKPECHAAATPGSPSSGASPLLYSTLDATTLRLSVLSTTILLISLM